MADVAADAEIMTAVGTLGELGGNEPHSSLSLSLSRWARPVPASSPSIASTLNA